VSDPGEASLPICGTQGCRHDTARSATGLALDAVRLLRERLWLRSLLLVVLFAVACVFLGRWQWARYVHRVDAAHRVEANYDSSPQPLQHLLPTPDTALPGDLEWRRVTLTGTYLTDRTVLVRNRPLNGRFGYEVVVPLRTGSGALFLVDRGWIPNGRTGSRPDEVPAPPSGRVEVVTRVRPSEPASDQRPPPGQTLRINIPHLAAGLGVPTYQAYGVLAGETPTTDTAPQPLPEPDLDLGNHLAYALQWWMFGAGGFLLLGYLALREAQNRDLRARGRDPAQVRRRRSRHEDEDEDEEW
jgi:cytochrome oxidase assembly protein ShyY1